MFQKGISRRSRRLISAIVCMTISFTGTCLGLQAQDCGTFKINPNTNARIHVAEPGVDYSFYIELPGAGVLTLEVEAAGADSEAVKLSALEHGCGDPVEHDAMTIERSGGYRMIAFPAAGTYVFSVASRAGRQAIEGFSLTTSFVPMAAAETAFYLEPESAGLGLKVRQTELFADLSRFKNEKEEVDPDPGKSLRRPPVLTLLAVRAAEIDKNEKEEVDPDPGNKLSRSSVDARLALFGDLATKNEKEEVDPDPGKSLPRGRVVTGMTSIRGQGGGWPSFRRDAAVSLWIGGTSTAAGAERHGAVLEWLARLMSAEMAAARLTAPGAEGGGWRLLGYEPDPVDP